MATAFIVNGCSRCGRPGIGTFFVWSRRSFPSSSLSPYSVGFCVFSTHKSAIRSFEQRTFSSYNHGKTTMSSWQLHQYGGTEELTLNETAKTATIKSPNEILIKVNASSINPIDVRMMGGYGRNLINVVRTQKRSLKAGTEFPLTLGRDFSGTVVETGRSVRNFRVGDEVWGALSVWRPGAHAEYTVASQSEISLKPHNVSHVEAASIPYVATTTWAAMCTIGGLSQQTAAGKRILILAGSGGVGNFSVQLAKSWAMHVTAICSADAMEQVTALGADVVVDYTFDDMWAQLGRLDKFDFILDPVGGDYTTKASQLLNPWKNSKLVTLVSPLLHNSDDHGVLPGLVKSAFKAGFDTMMGLKSGGSVRWAVFMPNGLALNRIRRMVESNQIKPVVQQVYPLHDVPGAFQKVSNGHLRGKIVMSTTADGVV